MIKRLLILLLAVAFAMTLAACGGAKEAPKEAPKKAEAPKEAPKAAAEQPKGDKFPNKPINVIVPFAAGDGGDILARPIIEKVGKKLGVPTVVINKPGAGMTIGYRETHDAKPDGYTIGHAISNLAVHKLTGNLPYDHHDYTMLGVFNNNIPAVIASTKTKKPFNSIKEVVDFAKDNPEKVTIATSTSGSVFWMVSLLFQEATKVKFNIIPQEGSGAFSVPQVAGGHADLGIVDLGPAKSQIEAGNIKLLAVFSDKRAQGQFSNAPTMKESGFDVYAYSTQAAIAPKGLPKDVADALSAAYEAGANDPEYQKFLVGINTEPLWLPPDKAVKYFDDQGKIYGGVLDRAGLVKKK